MADNVETRKTETCQIEAAEVLPGYVMMYSRQSVCKLQKTFKTFCVDQKQSFAIPVYGKTKNA